MTPKQQRNIFIAGGALAVLLVVVLITLWLTVWAPPSQQDFKDARATVTTIDESYDKIDDAYQKYFREVRFGFAGGKTRDTVVEESAAEKRAYIEAMSSHKAATKSLAESKAYRDTDVAKAFDVFMAKDKTYVANLDGFVYPILAFRSSLTTCDDVYKVATAGFPKLIASQHKEASKDCLADLDETAKSKPGPLAKYGKKVAELVRERQVAFDKAASGEMSLEDSAKRIKELGNEYGRLDPLGEVNKNAKSLTFAAELDALEKVLDRKAAE